MMRVGLGLISALGLGIFACSPATTQAEASAGGVQPAVKLPPPDRSALPPPDEQVQWSPPQPTSWALPGGARVLHVRHGAVPLVSLHLILPRGTATDPEDKHGLNSLMMDLLDEGAGDRTSLELGETFQSLATDFHVSQTVDSTALSLSMIADNFEASLELLADIVRRPHLSEAEFERVQAQRIAEAIAGEANPRVGWTVALLEALFGNGYGGHRSAGSRDSLRRISLADVKEHYRTSVVGQGATFVVAGGIDKARVDAGLKKSFGNWGGTSSLKPRAVAAPHDKRALYFVDYPGAAQSVLAVVKRTSGVGAEDLPATELFNHGFGGSFTGRINMNLREDKGYTYGANSVFRRYREAGFFLIVSNVRSDVTRESLDEVFGELSAVCESKPVSTKEWQEAKAGTLLGYPNEFEKISLVAGQFAEIPELGREVDWFTKWPSRVQGVTLEQTQAVAAKHCKRSDFDVVIAGDKKTVYPRLKELGYPLVSLDARGRRL